MTKEEMLAAVETNVTKLGNQGAINLSPLLNAMVEQLFATGQAGGDAPIVVKIAARGTEDGTRTTYELTTAQRDIDGYIVAANKGKENTRLFVEDNGALIGFPFLEIDELSVTGKGVLCDGEFGVVLSKSPGKSYFWHDAKVEAIPPVTLDEVMAYKMIFGTSYDRVEGTFKMIVGATEFTLTPAEMLIVNEEYNKRATDGNYTAMWADSISKYICCNPWFSGFESHNLNSAFYNARNAIFIDLNTTEIAVSDISKAFWGCERLEQISGILKVDSNTKMINAFKGCRTLTVFKMRGLSSDLDLSDCPMLAFEVFEELLNYGGDTSVAVYVHADVLSKINNNPAWEDVRAAMKTKPNIRIQTK